MKTKYALVFEIDSRIKTSQKLMGKFVKLQGATGWLGTVPDSDSTRDLGIDDSFSDVYNDVPAKDFLDEWVFYAKLSDEEMPIGIMIEEPRWVLFEKPKKIKS